VSYFPRLFLSRAGAKASLWWSAAKAFTFDIGVGLGTPNATFRALVLAVLTDQALYLLLLALVQ